jgi:hypothetical protein
MALKIISNLKYTDVDGADFEADCPSLELPVVGSHAIKKILDVTTGDQQVPLDDVGTLGYACFRSLGELVVVTTPDAPTVSNGGTPGAATWSYKIVAKQASGVHSAVSSAGTTATGNATLTDVNYNSLVWPAIDGATEYDVYRTAHGTTPSTDGLIGTTTAPAFNDTGLAGDASTAPATADDNIVQFGEDGSSYPVQVRGSGFSGPLEWNGAAIHYIAPTNASKVEVTLIEA